MKLTNKIVVDSVGSLNQLLELKLPVKTAFKLTKISRKLGGVLEAYSKVLAKLQKEHVKKDESGNPMSVEDENNPGTRQLIFEDPVAFTAAYQELVELETEVSFDRLKIEELGNIEVKPTTLFQIDWLFED